MRFSLPGTKGDGRTNPNARTWRIFWSYLPDWCLTIFLWVSRRFISTNLSLQSHRRRSTILLILSCFVPRTKLTRRECSTSSIKYGTCPSATRILTADRRESTDVLSDGHITRIPLRRSRTDQSVAFGAVCGAGPRCDYRLYGVSLAPHRSRSLPPIQIAWCFDCLAPSSGLTCKTFPAEESLTAEHSSGARLGTLTQECWGCYSPSGSP